MDPRSPTSSIRISRTYLKPGCFVKCNAFHRELPLQIISTSELLGRINRLRMQKTALIVKTIARAMPILAPELPCWVGELFFSRKLFAEQDETTFNAAFCC